GFGDCDNDVSNGCETPVTTTANCGMCGVACATLNGTPVCNTATMPATCAVGSCGQGYAHCAGQPGTNCETFVLGNDPNNCGACGHVCSTANGTPVCNGGVCGVGSCNQGFAHCAPTGTDCETMLGTTADCSACGDVCTTQNGAPACTGGHCAVGSCTFPFIN